MQAHPLMQIISVNLQLNIFKKKKQKKKKRTQLQLHVLIMRGCFFIVFIDFMFKGKILLDNTNLFFLTNMKSTIIRKMVKS